MDLKNKLQLLGTSVNNAIDRAKELSKTARKEKLEVGRELALIITKLEEAEHWRKQAEEVV